MSDPRPNRVDVHHHIFPASIKKAALSVKVGWTTPAENLPWAPIVSLQAMDRLGIRLAVLSLPAGLPAGPICIAYPDRFAFFACMPNLLDTPGCLQEIAFSLDKLGACGVAISSSYGEGAEAKYIGDDAFDAVWEELDRRATVVFLHGAQVPSSTPYPHPFLGIPVTEVPNETFKAAAHLVVTGKKHRFSNVKIILAHLGGATPFLAPRVAALSTHMGCPLSQDQILQDFQTFYYDTALGTHETTLKAMEAFVEPDRILFGSDFPAVSVDMVRWFTCNVDEFYSNDPERHAAIMYTNARALLRL